MLIRKARTRFTYNNIESQKSEFQSICSLEYLLVYSIFTSMFSVPFSIFDIWCLIFDDNQSQEKSSYVKRIRALRIQYADEKNDLHSVD